MFSLQISEMPQQKKLHDMNNIEITEILKNQLESKEKEFEIINKPVYAKEIKTSGIFIKRNHKGTSNLYQNK